MEIGIGSAVFWLVIGGLLAFGAAYAWLIYWMRRRGWLEPYTAFMVAFGVAVTLAANKGIHSTDPVADLMLEMTCFAASGIPMIVGSMWTHARAVERDMQMIEGESNGQA